VRPTFNFKDAILLRFFEFIGAKTHKMEKVRTLFRKKKRQTNLDENSENNDSNINTPVINNEEQIIEQRNGKVAISFIMLFTNDKKEKRCIKNTLFITPLTTTDKIDIMLNRLRIIEEDIASLKKDVASLEKNVNTLGGKIGDVFEISARSEIAKRYGQRYSEKFDLYDLNGIVRLISDKYKMPGEESIGHDSQQHLMGQRTNELADKVVVKNDVTSNTSYNIRTNRLHRPPLNRV
jgi:hypothetical protein